MSGTSLDGIDAALIETDGEAHIERLGFLTVPYEDKLRARIRACLNLPQERLAEAQDAERDLTFAHAQAVNALLQQLGRKPQDIDLIGFHGQTIAHEPEKKRTCQLGDGALLARLTGIRVVNDFRTADVLAGGQGAPLVPVYHRALAAGRDLPVAFLNIGGIANVTYAGDDVIAFDTGPGNALIDDWMLQKTGQKCDTGGATAAKGKAHEDIVAQLMAHGYFRKAPPKSLDRNAFSAAPCAKLSAEDGAATLTAFTVAGVAHALKWLPEKPKEWIVSGGGRLNAAIMKGLQAALGAKVAPVEELGLNGDAIEAEAFAYMAVRSLCGLPISFPKTTGVPQPMAGGKLNLIPDAA